MNKPLVSICSITYNHAPYIRECLDGFLMQKTDFPFEIIINDDCSTDGTTEIIKEYVKKYPDIIHPIFHNTNQYQKGIRGIFEQFVYPNANGKYIALCEADDYWTDPFKLQKQVDFLNANAEYGMIYTKTKFFYQNSLSFSNSNWGGPYTTFEDLITLPYCIPTASILLRKSIIEKYLTHWEINKTSWKMGDYPLSLFTALSSKIYFLPETTAVYRVLSSSASHFENIEKSISFLNSVYEVKKYFIGISNYNKLNKTIEASYDWEIWRRALKYNNFNLAKETARKLRSNSFKDKIFIIASRYKITFNILFYLKQNFGKK